MKSNPVSFLIRARLRGMALATLCLLPSPALLHAQLWTGTVSPYWDDPANWLGGVPVSGPNTALFFGGGTRLGPHNNLGDPFVLQTLGFGPNAPTFQLSGAAISFAAGGQLLQDGINEQFIQNNVQVQSDLLVGGEGSRGFTLIGALGGPGDIVKSGAFDLRLQGSGAAFTGTMQIDAGRVIIANASALENSTVRLNATNAITFATGAALLGGLSGTGNFSFGSAHLTVGANNENSTYSGRMSNGGLTSFTKVGLGILTLTGNNTYTGATTLRDGAIVVRDGGRLGNVAHPVYTGGDPLNDGEGALIVDGPGSRVAGSLFRVGRGGGLVLQNGGNIEGPAGQNISLVVNGGFEGYGTFDATVGDQASITATAPLTLNLQTPQLGGFFRVECTTVTINGPALPDVRTVTLNSGTEMATIVALNGLNLRSDGWLGGVGLIRGAITDRTSGAGIEVLTAKSYILPNANVGSEQWTFLNVLPHIDQVTLGGGAVHTRGEQLAFGTSISGRGIIEAMVTNSLPGGISDGGPSSVTLNGDLTVGTSAPRVSSYRNHFQQTTFNVGAHRFAAVGNTTITNSTVSLAGGTFHVPQAPEASLSSTSFTGFGVLVTGSDAGNATPIMPVVTGALSSAGDLSVPAGQLVQLISNAPVPVSGAQLSGGQLVSKAGFVLDGPRGISGVGVVDGPLSGSLATSLVATDALGTYEGIIRSITARILSTTPTSWNSAPTPDFQTVPAIGTTLHAPAGLRLKAPGAGGPVTIHAPNVSFGSTADIRFTSTTIHGEVNFGATDVVSIPNLTVTRAATMNGATLRDISTWTLHEPVTGNGFVHGFVGQGHRFVPQGSAPAGVSFESAPGSVLIVSETPYTIDWQDEANYFQFRGFFRATNGLTVQGTYFDFPVSSGVLGKFDARLAKIEGVAGNPHQVILGQTGLADAVELGELRVLDGVAILMSETPIKMSSGSMFGVSEIRSTSDIHLSDYLLVNGSATVTAPITGNAFIDIRGSADKGHSFVSLDVGSAEISDSMVTLTGLPGGEAALLPRINYIERTSFVAPQGVLLRAGSTMEIEESSFRGNLIVDGTIMGPSLGGLYVYGSLSGTGVIATGANLVGADALLNPGGFGATGMLTMRNLLVSSDPEGTPGHGEFLFELGPTSFDRLTVTQDLFLGDAGLSISLLDGFTLGPDLSFPIINVQGMLWDTFDGLAEGGTVANFGGWDLHVSYTGGNGNDVVLYTVPEPNAAIYLAGLGAWLIGRRRRQQGACELQEPRCS